MAYFKRRRRHKRDNHDHWVERPVVANPEKSESTGREAVCLKSLVDSRAKVIVVLTDGERLRGRIRYYDRDCFSLGPAGGGRRIFLRKSSVQYIYEE